MSVPSHMWSEYERVWLMDTMKGYSDGASPASRTNPRDASRGCAGMNAGGDPPPGPRATWRLGKR
eukprot:911047-Rhodomonas_salina.1